MNKQKKSRFKSKAIDEVVVEPFKSNIPKWLPLILVAVALLVYSNTFKNGFVLDDNSAIQSNYIVQKGAKAIPEIFSTEYRAGYWVARGNLYRPVSLAVFACLWDISPNDPFPGHVLNCLLYALTAFFLFRFLVMLSGDRNGLFSFLVTLIYIVHPLHTEVVANIKSLDEILSLLFLLLTGILLMKYQRHNKKRMLLMFPFTYMLALMSKESAITFLAVFPLLIYFMPDSKKKHYLAALATTCFSAGIYLLIRNAVLNAQHGEPYHLLLIDNSLVGAKDFMEKSASAFEIGRAHV